MSKGAYIGIDGVARKIKGGYIGVDNVARKIKKAYIGIGGVARPCWSGGELTYYGTTTEPLSMAFYGMGATTLGDYAIFAGGNGSTSNYNSVVQVYDKNLVRTTANNLNTGRAYLDATTAGGYALFGAGATSSGDSATKVIDVYNEASFTHSTLNDDEYRCRYGAATAGNLAIFAGGQEYSSLNSPASTSYTLNTVVAINTDGLTKSSLTALSYQTSFLAGCTLDDVAVFAGGASASSTIRQSVYIYNSSGTQSIGTNLPVTTYGLAATKRNTGSHPAQFAGGKYSSSVHRNGIWNIFPSGSVSTLSSTLSSSRAFLGAASLGEHTIFAGGNNGTSSSSYFNTVDVLDKSSTRTTHESTLSNKTAYISAATVGNYVLFAGGYNGYECNSIDVYTIN